MLTLNKAICMPEEMIMVPGIRPSSMTSDMFFTIDEDSEGEFYGVRDDFGMEDVPEKVWNIEEPISMLARIGNRTIPIYDKRYDYRNFEETHQLVSTVNWENIPKAYRKLSKTHFEMDDLRNVYKNLKGKDLEWLRKNKDTLKKIYDKHADDAGVDKEIECCEFNVEVHDTDSFVIAAYEERTHESFKRLRFWERMVWMIGHCPDVAYDKAIANMDGETITDDEAIWVTEVTQGMRNNGMMRYAQFRMMEARKCTVNQLDYNGFIIEFKGVDLHTFAHMFKFNNNKTKERIINCITHGCANRIKSPKFTKVTMKVEPSEKFEKFIVLNFLFNGAKVRLMKGKTCTNWLNPNKLNHEDMNEAINWARKELTKK